MIDLRSDTVTKPTPEMREEMAQAEVGDDVYDEDPSVNELQREAARIFDRESALFVPSGTMGNQIAVRIYTEPGDEVILDSESHIFNFEMGTMANFSGVIPRAIETDESYLPLKEVRKSIRPQKYYVSQTGLITIENTQNVKGGSIYPREKVEELIKLAGERKIPIHLDGARIFNASLETEVPVDELAEGVDSIMFCLSKGLGAPVGSMLVGDEDFIEEARRVRKQLGGGMRQAGILAKAGFYALYNHVERLKEDHRNAKILAGKLKKIVEIEITEPETNILTIDLTNSMFDESELVDEMEEEGVLAGSIGPQKVRFVTHLGIEKGDVEKAGEIVKSIFS